MGLLKGELVPRIVDEMEVLPVHLVKREAVVAALSIIALECPRHEVAFNLPFVGLKHIPEFVDRVPERVHFICRRKVPSLAEDAVHHGVSLGIEAVHVVHPAPKHLLEGHFLRYGITLGILGLGLQESIDIPVDLQLVDDVDRQLNGLEDGCTTFAFPASLLCDEIEVSFHNSV